MSDELKIINKATFDEENNNDAYTIGTKHIFSLSSEYSQ